MNSNSKSSKGSASSAHLSRPRFVKVRKQSAAAASHTSIPNPGFNPFTPSANPQMSSGASTLNPAFVFRASASGMTHDPLLDKIRNMNISDGGGGGKGMFVFESGGKKSSESDGLRGDSGLDTELPDQISKLNIKDSVTAGGGGLGYDAMRNVSGDSKNVLPDMFNKLNIKESMASDQGGIGFGDRSGSVYNESHQGRYGFQAGDVKLASSSPGMHFGPAMNTLNASSVGTTYNDEVRTPYVEFKTPNLKEYVASELDRNRESRGDATKEAKLKKKKWDPKTTAGHVMCDEEFVFGEGSSRQTCDSSEAYSPMDVSPYQETVAQSTRSRETSITSDEVLYPDDSYVSSESHPTVSNSTIDEDLAAATNQLNINKSNINFTSFGCESGTDCFDKGSVAGGPSEESISGAETESFKSAVDQLEYSSDTFVTAGDTEVSSCSSYERQDLDGKTQFNFASSIEDTGSSSFTFAASSSNHVPSSADTRHYKKKHRLKVSNDNYSSFVNDKVPLESPTSPFFPISGTSSNPSPWQGRKGDESKLFGKSENKSELTKEQEVKQVSFSSATSIAAQEACEKWRLRFNLCLIEAYNFF